MTLLQPKHDEGSPSRSGGWACLWRKWGGSGGQENETLHRRRLVDVVETLPANRLTTLVLFVLAALFEALLLVSLDIRQKNVQKEILQEIQRNQNLVILENNLDIELAGLQSPERIAEIARNQLGLAMPNHQQIQVLP